MPIINTRVDAELASRFHELCAERDVTASEVLRQAITAFVERSHAAPIQPGPPVRTYVADGRTALAPVHRSAKEPEPGTWGAKAGYGERLKKDKGSK